MKFSSINFFLSISSVVLLTILGLVFFFLINLGILKIPLYLFFIFSALVIFAMLSFYVFFIGYPIQKILKSVKTLTSGSEFVPIETDRKDEIGSISHFINQVVERVKSLSGEIKEGRRVVGEVNTAADIQKSVLPEKAPDGIVGINLVAKSKSSSEVGGDSFDIMKQGKNTLFYIGDVTGHGVPAALIMMMANTAIRSFTDNNLDPKSIFVKTNELLFSKIKTNHFMSAVMLRWDNEKQKMYYTGAGHETILHYSMDKMEVDNIKSGGIALKMIPNCEALINEKELDFKEGDAILIYSDGITEAQNSQGDRYGLDRLIEQLKRNGPDTAHNIFNTVTKDYSEFVGTQPQEDDVSMIVIKNVGQYNSSGNIEIGLSAENKDGINSMKWGWE